MLQIIWGNLYLIIIYLFRVIFSDIRKSRYEWGIQIWIEQNWFLEILTFKISQICESFCFQVRLQFIHSWFKEQLLGQISLIKLFFEIFHWRKSLNQAWSVSDNDWFYLHFATDQDRYISNINKQVMINAFNNHIAHRGLYMQVMLSFEFSYIARLMHSFTE